MAQQTQAERAGAHYTAFVERFPDVTSLADAPLAEVLRLWSGLGYNSRAKRLRDAAAHIAHHGWPDDLTDLPGVGPYTAAAVACFALGEHRAVVDTNVRRVLGRWEGTPLDGDGEKAAGRYLVEPAAEWNQAVMDLGAAVCTAQGPQCDRCPVARWCAGPNTYRPPPPQTRYQGSLRQARSAVLLHLAHNGAGTAEDIAAATGVDGERVSQAIGALAGDGLLTEQRGLYRVAD